MKRVQFDVYDKLFLVVLNGAADIVALSAGALCWLGYITTTAGRQRGKWN